MVKIAIRCVLALAELFASKLPLIAELVEVLEDIRAGPVDRPDELAPYDARSVDNKGFGVSRGAVAVIAFFTWIEYREEVDLVGAQEAVIVSLSCVHAYSQYGNSRPHAVLQPHQGRHFVDARRAVSSPEVQHHRLAAQLAKRDRAVGIPKGEVGSRGTDHARRRAAFTSATGQCQDS